MPDRPDAAPLARRSPAMHARRADILRAAVELFSEKGYLSATTDEIADRAGLTKRTLYHYMGSKNHILYEIHREFIGEGLRRWEAVARADHSPGDTVRELIREHLAIVFQYRTEIRVFFEEAKHLDEAERAIISKQRDEYEAIFRTTVAAAIESREFRDLDPTVTALTILSMLTGVYRWYHPQEGLSAAELTTFMETQLMNGMTEPVGAVS